MSSKEGAGRVIVAASLLACDFSNVAGEAKRAEAAGSDWLHMDVMDGNFVDNISFGPAFVAAAQKSTRLPVDVHLMIVRPDHYFPRFVDYADNITVHVEAQHDVAKTLAAIRVAGCTAGLSLNPATPFEAVKPYLEMIDLLLVMTVVPGFGGQAFMPETMKKVEAANEFKHRHNLAYHIEVDGGIQPATAPVAVSCGADVLVAGSAVFGKKDMAAAVRALR